MMAVPTRHAKRRTGVQSGASKKRRSSGVYALGELTTRITATVQFADDATMALSTCRSRHVFN